jgi:hypothetical protein
MQLAVGVPPPYDGMQLAVGGVCTFGIMTMVRDVFWVDDSDFCGGEFAKIADECCQGHSFAFSIDSFARE